MKWLATSLVAAGLVLAAAGGEAAARKASGASQSKSDRIDINYGEPTSAESRVLYTLLKERQALEKIRDLLRPLRLPHRVLIQVRGCDGISNAWSDEESVTVCYEFLDD